MCLLARNSPTPGRRRAGGNPPPHRALHLFPTRRWHDVGPEAQKSRGGRVSVEEHFPPTASVCDTVARYKGLESLVVILWLNGQVDPQEARELLYVALSRARSLIVVVGTEADCARVLVDK